MHSDVFLGFVDRAQELALFRRMLAGETDRRVLLVLEAAEQGKTYFLLRLFYECEQQSPAVPVALLDFDQRCSGLIDYLSVAREIRRYLGDELTPAICACEHKLCSHRPLVNVQTGKGDASVDWGKRGRFTDVTISDVAGRDHIQLGFVSETPSRRAEMGRALFSDLARLAGAFRRIVLLLDTFEHVSLETVEWLERWLFEPMCRELHHVNLVVAGRPECESLFTQPRLWSHLIARIRFDPFTDDDILTHYCQRGLPVAEAEMPLLLDLARLSPARMAQVGDWLEQSR